MDTNGNMKLNGKKCYISNIAELIDIEEKMDPQMVIALIIDEEPKCKK